MRSAREAVAWTFGFEDPRPAQLGTRLSMCRRYTGSVRRGRLAEWFEVNGVPAGAPEPGARSRAKYRYCNVNVYWRRRYRHER